MGCPSHTWLRYCQFALSWLQPLQSLSRVLPAACGFLVLCVQTPLLASSSFRLTREIYTVHGLLFCCKHLISCPPCLCVDISYIATHSIYISFVLSTWIFPPDDGHFLGCLHHQYLNSILITCFRNVVIEGRHDSDRGSRDGLVYRQLGTLEPTVHLNLLGSSTQLTVI